MSMDAGLEHGETMFHALFNTAFISDNVMKLEFDGMDVRWGRQNQFPKEFMAEIIFSQADAATSLTMVDLSSDEEPKENRIKISLTMIPSFEPSQDAITTQNIVEPPKNAGPQTATIFIFGDALSCHLR
ncbi:formin-like protein 18 [Eucalyptus grandis]|uniref:formin-like protein 18 n=1 Tax=Eucalyptus grandis TaxID=71139 RepID=UPI000526D04A|nr:formin-like protein 18 [Eucalyptus grandis]XP_039164863.1 formin-like protein 18 [Eucalyptus grandis]